MQWKKTKKIWIFLYFPIKYLIFFAFHVYCLFALQSGGV